MESLKKEHKNRKSFGVHRLGFKIVRIVAFSVLATAVVSSAMMTFLLYVYTMANSQRLASFANSAITPMLYTEEADKYFELLVTGELSGVSEQEEWLISRHYWESRDYLDLIRERGGFKYVYIVYPTEDGYYYLMVSDTKVPFGALELYGYDTERLFARKMRQMADSENKEDILEIDFEEKAYMVLTPLDSALGKIYVGVTIPIDRALSDYFEMLIDFLFMILATTAVLIVLAMVDAYRTIIRPVKTLDDAAFRLTQSAAEAQEKYLAGNREDWDWEPYFSHLDIKSKNEIGGLHQSLTAMENGMKASFSEMLAASSEKERLGAELEIATTIQQGVLPQVSPKFAGHPEYEIAASMKPAKEVGGDFYDFFYIDDDHLALVIADVSGKGVPAALFMMVSKMLVKDALMRGYSPSEALSFANDQLCENNPNEMFVTVWIGIVTLSTGEVVAANAGHEYPFLLREGGEYEMLEDPHGFVCGGMEGMPYEDYTFTLPKNGRIFVYTDGVNEAHNEDNALFEMERIGTTLNEDTNRPPQETIEAITEAIRAFVGGQEQFDDITMVSFWYKGASS